MNRPDDLEALKALNLGYIRSVQEADVRWFDEHLSADFMNTNPDASIVDRKGFLERIARGAGITGLRAEDVLVRVMGDLGIIHARTTYRLPDGKAGAGRYTDIWFRDGERWLCVAAHVARG